MIGRALVIYLIFSLTASLAALALAWWAGRRGPLPEGTAAVLLAALGGWL